MNHLKQTTSIRLKTFESSLEWNIENFSKYTECGIYQLKSETRNYQETHNDENPKYQWKFGLNFPKTENEKIKLFFEITDNFPSVSHVFAVKVTTNMIGHQLLSPANRNLVKSKGIYAQPEEVEAFCKETTFEKLSDDGRKIIEIEFVDMKEVGKFIFGGTLSLDVKVWMREFQVENFWK
ncbi:hypothetical protein PVAND_015958 [Polypedilum vanderplanki]|uniref:Uncharacterized protein n=1 Tax=Polypedilum vanderplanki TaxID=319348 RepID=A0A9J6BDQ4_POLVA|nr:hypothetical protein PVAND_015958 [Polypedilum vanderplanki]